MSVLIKGMDMPKTCFLCPLSVLSEDRLFCELTSEEVVRAKIDGNCPLIPVPPHGRLIDADALIKTNNPIGKMMVFGGQYVYTEDEIQNAPTIIEAEVDDDS